MTMRLSEMPRLVDLEDESFDPFVVEKLSHGHVEDPYPVIHGLMREKGRVIPGSYRLLFSDVPDISIGHLEQWIVLGFDNCMQVLTDPLTFGNHGVFRHNLAKSFGRSITTMDPPDHSRYRKVFQRAFLPNIVAKWSETLVDPVLEDLMSKFLPRGEAELVEEFTHHFPFRIIYRQLDLEPEQAPIFHKLAIAQLLNVVGKPQGQESSEKLGVFFQQLLDIRRADPGDDLVSQLALVEADGDRLPDEVIVSFLRQLMNAGGDTTYRGTSTLLACLLTHPDQLAAVSADRSLVPQAIDEALRWDGPVNVTWRYVRKDAEIGGVPVKEGTVLNVVLGSANRDPEKYADPDRFDIFRPRGPRAIPFASGPHVCIGQHLARLEMTRAVNAILDKLKNLRLDERKPRPQNIGHNLRAPDFIHVKFDPA